MSALYLIAHIGHTISSHEHICWWKPDSLGYTICVEKAGRYRGDQAASICTPSHGSCIAIAEEHVLPLARSTPYYRRSNGTLAPLYDGDNHHPVPNSRGCWDALLQLRILQNIKPDRVTPIGVKARAIYLDGLAAMKGGAHD